MDIDFTLLMPGDSYVYLSVNMLIEFTVEGLAVPTRLDLRPHKLPPFSAMSKDSNLLILEVFRFLLFLQVVYSLMADFYKMGIWNIFRFQTLRACGTDIALVIMQIYCFSIKFADSFSSAHPSMDVLNVEYR